MIKLIKQDTSSNIFINHNFIVSIEDIQNGSRLTLPFASGSILVMQSSSEIFELIKQL